MYVTVHYSNNVYILQAIYIINTVRCVYVHYVVVMYKIMPNRYILAAICCSWFFLRNLPGVYGNARMGVHMRVGRSGLLTFWCVINNR